MRLHNPNDRANELLDTVYPAMEVNPHHTAQQSVQEYPLSIEQQIDEVFQQITTNSIPAQLPPPIQSNKPFFIPLSNQDIFAVPTYAVYGPQSLQPTTTGQEQPITTPDSITSATQLGYLISAANIPHHTQVPQPIDNNLAPASMLQPVTIQSGSSITAYKSPTNILDRMLQMEPMCPFLFPEQTTEGYHQTTANNLPIQEQVLAKQSNAPIAPNCTLQTNARHAIQSPQQFAPMIQQTAPAIAFIQETANTSKANIHEAATHPADPRTTPTTSSINTTSLTIPRSPLEETCRLTYGQRKIINLLWLNMGQTITYEQFYTYAGCQKQDLFSTIRYMTKQLNKSGLAYTIKSMKKVGYKMIHQEQRTRL